MLRSGTRKRKEFERSAQLEETDGPASSSAGGVDSLRFLFLEVGAS